MEQRNKMREIRRSFRTIISPILQKKDYKYMGNELFINVDKENTLIKWIWLRVDPIWQWDIFFNVRSEIDMIGDKREIFGDYCYPLGALFKYRMGYDRGTARGKTIDEWLESYRMASLREGGMLLLHQPQEGNLDEIEKMPAFQEYSNPSAFEKLTQYIHDFNSLAMPLLDSVTDVQECGRFHDLMQREVFRDLDVKPIMAMYAMNEHDYSRAKWWIEQYISIRKECPKECRKPLRLMERQEYDAIDRILLKRKEINRRIFQNWL